MKRLACFLWAGVAWGAPPAIDVEPGEWGARTEDVRVVLELTASALLSWAGDQQVPRVVVAWRKDGPLAAYGLDLQGRAQVFINAQDRRWAQTIFQFAHEFAHVMAMHGGKGRTRSGRAAKEDLWLEESLCETASLYVLRALAVEWERDPPFENWRSYAQVLRVYAAHRMSREGASLPEDVSFVEWFRESRAKLRGGAMDREAFSVIAAQFLPSFEKSPELWEAVFYLDRDAQESGAPFASWMRACPPRLKPGVEKLAEVFGGLAR